MIKENLCTKKSFQEFNFKLWLVPASKNNFIQYRQCGLLNYKLVATFLAEDNTAFESKDGILQLVREKFKKDASSAMKNKVECLNAWINVMSYGDFVCCFDGIAKCFLGVVLGPCQNSSDKKYKYVRPVLWLGNVLSQKDMLMAQKKHLQQVSKKELLCMTDFATANILLNALDQCSTWYVPVLHYIASLVKPNVLQEISKSSFKELQNYQKKHQPLDLIQEHKRIAQSKIIYGQGQSAGQAAGTKTAATSIIASASTSASTSTTTTITSLADEIRQLEGAQTGAQVKQSLQQSEGGLQHDEQNGHTFTASLLERLDNASAATVAAFEPPAAASSALDSNAPAAIEASDAATHTPSGSSDQAQTNGAEQIALLQRIKSLIAANLCQRSGGNKLNLLNEKSSLMGNGFYLANLMQSIISARIYHQYGDGKMPALLTELLRVQGFELQPFECNKYGYYTLVSKSQDFAMQDCFCLLIHPLLSLCARETVDFCRSLLAKYGVSYVVLLSWSGFTEQVKESIAMEFLQFRLWTGEDLVQCYLKHYHLLSPETQQQIPLKLVWTLR